MPETKVFEGSTKRIDVLDADGNPDSQFDPQLDNALLEKIYRTMVLCRTFDRKAIALQRTGRMYTYAPCEGQEALQVCTALQMQVDDWLYPSYREHAAFIARGVPLSSIYAYWMGKEDGARFPGEEKNAPFSIPVGSQTCHAAGAAYALKLKRKSNFAAVYFGDGASSEGDFHESLNFAGIYKLPAIFICTNNQYAISTPRKLQTASESIAQKALAYGMYGVQVNGMDPLAVWIAMKSAIERARNGGGATLIEALCYRFGPHTTADDPTKYRVNEEVELWRQKDWTVHFVKYLQKKGIWSPEYQSQLEGECTAKVEEAVLAGEAYKQDVSTMFDFLYEKMPAEIAAEKQEFLADLEEWKKAGLMA